MQYRCKLGTDLQVHQVPCIHFSKAAGARGLVVRQQSATNKKHIELHLTADAQPILADGIAIQKEFAKHALAGISQEELAVFKSVFDKISNNAEAYLQQNK